MPRSALLGCAISALIVPASLAQALIAPEGRYIHSCESSLAWEDSDGRLEVVGNELRFWEHVCTLTNPVNVRDLPTTKIYDGACEGEGLKWSTRIILSSTSYLDNRKIDIIDNRGGNSFYSCP